MAETTGPFTKRTKRARRVVVSFHDDEYREVMKHARDDDRSVNNFVRLAVLKEIERRNAREGLSEKVS